MGCLVDGISNDGGCDGATETAELITVALTAVEVVAPEMLDVATETALAIRRRDGWIDHCGDGDGASKTPARLLDQSPWRPLQ